MTNAWLERRMVHTCSITRDVGTARSDIGEVISVGSAVGTGQKCRFVEERQSFASERTGLVMQKVNTLLLPPATDVQANDMIHTIEDGAGNALAAGTFSVNSVVTRRSVNGDASHMSADLERITTT